MIKKSPEQIHVVSRAFASLRTILLSNAPPPRSIISLIPIFLFFKNQRLVNQHK